MRELIREACESDEPKIFQELINTFPAELLREELAALDVTYRQRFEELDRKWGHRYSVLWHGNWVNNLYLVSPPVESSDPQVKCQAWRFASETGQKYYAWQPEHWKQEVTSTVAIAATSLD